MTSTSIPLVYPPAAHLARATTSRYSSQDAAVLDAVQAAPRGATVRDLAAQLSVPATAARWSLWRLQRAGRVFWVPATYRRPSRLGHGGYARATRVYYRAPEPGSVSPAPAPAPAAWTAQPEALTVCGVRVHSMRG